MKEQTEPMSDTERLDNPAGGRKTDPGVTCAKTYPHPAHAWGMVGAPATECTGWGWPPLNPGYFDGPGMSDTGRLEAAAAVLDQRADWRVPLECADEDRAVAALLRAVASRRAATPLGLAPIPEAALAVADAVLGAATPHEE